MRAPSPLDEVPPYVMFGGVSDDTWRWLHLEGRERCEFLDRYMPGLTGDPGFEAEFVGWSGREALTEGFQIYELVKRLCEQHAKPLTPSSRVLDFGCGWGRVIRFFLKDVAPENTFGIDAQDRAIAACLETNRWSRFERCEPLPPTGFEPDSFELAYASFVFSHLSEEAHQRWLEEFERLLRPGGVLVLTTYDRELLERAANTDSTSSETLRVMAERFAPVDRWLSAYDRGEFCFERGPEQPEHFGTAFIPEAYVRKHWTKHFAVQDYIAAPAWGQNVIVCTKRA